MKEMGDSPVLGKLQRCDDLITTTDQRTWARMRFMRWLNSDAMQTIVRDVFGAPPGSGSRSIWLPDSTSRDDITVKFDKYASFMHIAFEIYVRKTDGKVARNYLWLSDASDILRYETFHDLKTIYIHLFFVRLHDNSDRWDDIDPTGYDEGYGRIKPASDPMDQKIEDNPVIRKMDPDEFKDIVDQIEKECEEGLSTVEAARRGNLRADFSGRRLGKYPRFMIKSAGPNWIPSEEAKKAWEDTWDTMSKLSRCGIEQLVACQLHGLEVAGPSPAPATNPEGI